MTNQVKAATCTEVPSNALIYQEGQVQGEHGYKEDDHDLNCLSCFPFSVERVSSVSAKAFNIINSN